MRKYAILIDGSNLFATLKEIHLQMDFQKLLTYFDGELVRAFYFTAVPEDKTKLIPYRPLWDMLEYNGYTMVTKPTKEYIDEEGNLTIKGNMDVEIVLTALDISRHITDLVLVSGDGDFVSLVERLQLRDGIKVHVMSTLNQSMMDEERRPSMIADSLRRQADTFIDLNHPSVKARLRRGDRPDRPPEKKFSFMMKK